MANLTNSAKLIQEMAKKANRTELPEVNNSTVNFTINGNTGSQSMTTNQPNNSTVNLTVDKATVGLGNVDNTSDANKPISTATQAALDLKADKSDLSSVYKYKGSVASYSNLPSTGLTAGDVYNVEDTGMNYAWTGSAWDALGSTVDLSNYLAKDNTTVFTPTGDYQPATKKYVDDNAGTEYNAGPGITIGSIHSDMQGPAPDGFHVPLLTEWQAVYNVWTALGGGSDDGTNFGIALKLPFAGYRGFTDGNVYQEAGQYWSSSHYSGNRAYSLFLDSLIIQNRIERANGISVRCFKDEPVIPTSSWTKLYGTSIEAGGIFWSSTDGLISLSSDGQTWITIADKNLGATQVWNNGDTLSEANCGGYFQWGNNYMFPFTGTVTTSSTQVDASNYGPGNYYNSSTFITGSINWSSVRNDNLWGGVSQGTWISNGGDTIVNTGVLSVNGQIGDVTVKYNSGHGIEIGERNGRQGPAPEGFHVPSIGEWTTIMNIWTTLGGDGSDGTNFGIVLKLPMAGYRDYSDSSVSLESEYGTYWTYTSTSSTQSLVFTYAFIQNVARPRAEGCSLRCFKDTPVIPTSSWTKLYGTSIEAGGIFWSPTDGLISLSSDGINWRTIMDKNLGATQVWNNGDTLSEANCGYYYQRGNNYGFAWTGTIKTSSTQVDASNYGPLNYYNSDTFIIGNEDWNSVYNADLWGYTTSVVTNAIKNTGVLSVNGQTGDVTISGGTDYSWVEKTGSSIELGLRTIVNTESNITLTAPSSIKDGEEYVLRCVNVNSYTLTLGTGFTNPFDVDLSLSANATDQFVFLAVQGTLELQPQFVVSEA